MATHVIGDLQGCLQPLLQLLDTLAFNPDRDQLWFCGDLVNRGPDSLGCLRAVYERRDNIQLVLGNHDLHFLAVALGCQPAKRGDTLDALLAAPDRERLVEFLLQQPLAIQHEQWLLSHAGLPPGWTAQDALRASADVSAALQHQPVIFFRQMYGNEPRHWSQAQTDSDRRRFTVNALTRMRYVDPDGGLELQQKGAPGSQPVPLLPWFDHPDRPVGALEIVFGHWATLHGQSGRSAVHALDTGCVYGLQLTALTLETGQRCSVPGWQR